MNKYLFWIAPAALICTMSPVFSAQYLSVEQAQKLCFPNATAWESRSIALDKVQINKIESDSGVKVGTLTQKVWLAYRDKVFMGWLILDQVIGKHEVIQWALALDAKGKVIQLEILDYKEPYGSEVRRKSWRSQFIGKEHGVSFQYDRDIQTISGATLSSRHITEGVKRLLSFYKYALKGV